MLENDYVSPFMSTPDDDEDEYGEREAEREQLEQVVDDALHEVDNKTSTFEHFDAADVRRRLSEKVKAYSFELGEPAPSDPVDLREQSYFLWTVAHSGLNATHKLILHAIVLRTNFKKKQGCTAGPMRLAQDTSLSSKTIYAHVGDCLDQKLLAGKWCWEPDQDRELIVTIQPVKEQLSVLHKLWQAKRPDAEWQGASRYWWQRALLQSSRLPFTAKATGMAVSLLTNAGGYPRKWTTREELAHLASLSVRKGITVQLKVLEEAGFIVTKSKRGRGGGLLITLSAGNEAAHEHGRGWLMSATAPDGYRERKLWPSQSK